MEIGGVPTTREFHLRLLDHPGWVANPATTTFLERHPEVIPAPAPTPPVPAARGDAPVDLTADVDGRRFTVRLHGAAGLSRSDSSPGRRPPPPSKTDAPAAASDGAVMRSPIQGTVVRVALQPGDAVRRGQTVCVVEAMKMENDVAAHRDGVLRSVAATPGMAVRVGDPLAEIA
jgi:acetyl-CoA/propionyl-CoA carboxylase biotin carboxyl carrier protein